MCKRGTIPMRSPGDAYPFQGFFGILFDKIERFIEPADGSLLGDLLQGYGPSGTPSVEGSCFLRASAATRFQNELFADSIDLSSLSSALRSRPQDKS